MKRTLEKGVARATSQPPFDLNSPNGQTWATPGTPGTTAAPRQPPAPPAMVAPQDDAHRRGDDRSLVSPAMATLSPAGPLVQHSAPTLALALDRVKSSSLADYELMGSLSFETDDDSESEAPARFSEEDLKQRTELKLENDTGREDLQTLRMALPSNTTITRIALDGSYPDAAKAVLTALQTNITVTSLSVVCWQSCFDPKVATQLTALLRKQTPLQSFELCIVKSEDFNRVFTLDQDFFEALLAHPHLEKIFIRCDRVDRVYLHNPQQLAARLRDNSKLKHLELRSFQDCAKLWAAIAPGLEGNRSITTLDLRHNDLSGLAPAIASLLRANPAITSLDIQSTEWKAAELGIIIDAVASSTTLKGFFFYRACESGAGGAGTDLGVNARRPALGAAIGTLLATNQHLESLGIHSQLDEQNVVAIRQGLNANTSLRFFDPGDIRGVSNPEGEADATGAINQLFATNSRLNSVMLRPQQGEGADPTAGLTGLERNASVRTLNVKFTGATEGVISLLQNNRHLTSLTLVTKRQVQNPIPLAQQLEVIFDAVADNTTLLEFKLDCSIPDDPRKRDLDLVLARFDALCGRNQRLQAQREQQRQRVSAPATGIGLLNEFRRNGDANWPELRTEEATAIASAIDTVLPPEEAQRVLDVLRFADVRPS